MRKLIRYTSPLGRISSICIGVYSNTTPWYSDSLEVEHLAIAIVNPIIAATMKV
jgi:hypothetical protein